MTKEEKEEEEPVASTSGTVEDKICLISNGKPGKRASFDIDALWRKKFKSSNFLKLLKQSAIMPTKPSKPSTTQQKRGDIPELESLDQNTQNDEEEDDMETLQTSTSSATPTTTVSASQYEFTNLVEYPRNGKKASVGWGGCLGKRRRDHLQGDIIRVAKTD
ncbi:unnamed protein product [Caenorhabditis angaria]|uniref:Uncharacterized protein n=1 Tax=Caenorhabditis angaria TaxID=860376 RepID=A0A9P1ICF1_9PELO|nr:unnamed protein product [Caenorhabditis angaria]